MGTVTSMLLLLLLAATGLCAGASPPNLFINDPDGAHTLSVASAAAVESRLAGVKIVQGYVVQDGFSNAERVKLHATPRAFAAYYSRMGVDEFAGITAGTGQPSVTAVQINMSLLASQTPRLQLTLPNTNRPIIINIRNDLSGASAPEDPVLAAARQKAAATAGIPDAVQPNTWVGEVAGSAGPFSTVIFTTTASGAVYGNIRYYDRRTNRFRTFQVLPDITTGSTPSPPATAAFSASSDITPELAAALFPTVNTKRNIVVEYVEEIRPRLFKKPPTDRQTSVVAQGTDSGTLQTVDTTPEAPAPADPSLIPIQPSHESISATQVQEQITIQSLGADTNSAATTETAGDASATGNRKLLQSGTRNLLQSGTVQDVLIVYTAAAAVDVGGVEAMMVKAQENVARTNKAYVDSGMSLSLRLVGARLIKGWKEDNRTDTFLTDLKDGRIPGVHRWRNELAADMVSLFHVNAGTTYCGIGYLLGARGTQEWAYSEVAKGCFDGFAFAHEIGHNQGCTHHPEDNDGEVPYGYGWRRCDVGPRSFKTIMAYTCPEQETNEVAIFSNPQLAFNGLPAGDADRAHCARHIQETAPHVAAWRPTVVPPDGGPNGTNLVRLRNLDRNKCLTAPAYKNGRQVAVFDCNGRGNQQWRIEATGELRVLGAQGKCLDVDGSRAVANGQRVWVWDCQGGDNQRWFLDSMNRIHPYSAPNFCLDLARGDTTNGNVFRLRRCAENNDNQVFEAPQIPTGLSPNGRGVKSRLNDLCMGVTGRLQDVTTVQMRQCRSQSNQQWFAYTDGSLRVKANKNFCVDASSTARGADVYMISCHGGDNQKWFRDSLERLRPYSAPDKCLDIRGANRGQGARVQLWDCLDLPQQKWYV